MKYTVVMLLALSGCGYVSDAQNTVYEETKASTLLKKYEWFKDAAASLDKKMADVAVYEAKIRGMEESYEGEKRKDWDRVDKQQHSQWNTEMLGIKASYNKLAADFNAQMAKENYRFCEVGRLPEGADKPLPRKYKPYITE